jgi:hypothetical protein
MNATGGLTGILPVHLTKFLAHISQTTYKEGTHMKQLLNYSRFIVLALLLAAAAGCASTGSSENLLAAAGFQQRTADTPKKQQLLTSLPRNQLTLITWQGRNYYVQPDNRCPNLAWVGSPAEFQTYQQLRLARQLSNDNLMAAQMNQAAMMSWGGAWGPGFYRGFGRWR